MKRNVKTLVKLILLSGITVLFTVLIFRIVDSSVRPQNYIAKVENKVENLAKHVGNDYHGMPQEAPLNNEKIDWHDYKSIEKDRARVGPGEQGKPAYLSATEHENYDKLFKTNGFNAALSDKIALDRSLPDIRHKQCQSKKYLKNLPTVSIIVPFHNEHWTTLLRTAASALNRSPKHLVKEIILVDDASTKEFSKGKLDNYLAANMSKVRVIHLPERSGLIRARLAGAKAASGEVLIFLDSHTECNVNWLPPLLEPIQQDYKVCVCPFIDVIQYETFEYRSQDEGARGAFDWEFFYKRLPLLPENLEHPAEPFKSPVMAGGLFAISSKFFWELGGYDEELQIWGGEQYELSFKIWQCGGEMYDAPCSRVGHIYRKYAPFPNPGKGDFVGRNFRRVAEVWMDEYAQYLYMRRPHYKMIDPGDLSKQREIRERLHCKPFKWFIENVAFDLPLKYPMIEPGDFAYGEIRNLGAPQLCMDAGYKARDGVLEVSNCVSDTKAKGDQNFTLTWHKDIRISGKGSCLDVSDPNDKAEITLFPCHGQKGNQYWKYDVDKQWIVHGGNPRCLDCDPGRRKVFVTFCDEASKTQKWRFENVNLTMIADWDKVGVL